MTHQILIRNTGHRFDAEPGESVLQAAQRAGFVLPHACRDGACGSCKGRVIEGSVDHGKSSDKALPEAERAAGSALFCQASPKSDLVIEAREVRNATDIAVRTLPARVEAIERPTADVMVIRLKLPAAERLQFFPGQYLDILLKDGKRRSFSIANAPHDAEFIELHIRHITGGAFTDQIFGNMKERDILRIEAPHGTCYLREEGAKPIVIVASGTGFAPAKAMIEHAFARGITRPITLYWGGRRPNDLYLAELPQRWAAERAGFRYVPVISDALPEDHWTGRTGFVHRAVMEDLPDMSGHQVYACGVPVMVTAAGNDFIGQCRLPENEFFADAFTFQSGPAQAASPK